MKASIFYSLKVWLSCVLIGSLLLAIVFICINESVLNMVPVALVISAVITIPSLMAFFLSSLLILRYSKMSPIGVMVLLIYLSCIFAALTALAFRVIVFAGLDMFLVVIPFASPYFISMIAGILLFRKKYLAAVQAQRISLVNTNTRMTTN